MELSLDIAWTPVAVFMKLDAYTRYVHTHTLHEAISGPTSH
jgi:hypothetical protein